MSSKDIRPIPVFGSTDELTLAIFREFFKGQDIHIGTLFSDDLKPPVIICRKERRSGTVAHSSPDENDLQAAIVAVNTITDGLDADESAEELQEACRIALVRAQLTQAMYPNAGSIALITNSSPPSRVSDWATSTGVVQYSELPKTLVRYEAIYRLMIRPPRQSTITNRFLTLAN